MSASVVSLSIIIPVLNEADNIVACLQSLAQMNLSRSEIIVVDGGSDDATVQLAARYSRVVSSAKGRGRQMNTGANYARGEVLLFLHADTRLPDNADEHIQRVMQQGASWGRFDVRLSGRSVSFRVIERMMNWRSRLTSVATGDQAIFVRRELFRRVGGFPELALMEDIALSKRLRRHRRAACIAQPVMTSSRRWQQHGTMRTVLLMWWLRFLYFTGVSPDRLASMYYQK